MIPAGPLFHKPSSIVAARNILYAVIFLSILSAIIGEFTTTQRNLSSAWGIGSLLINVVVIFLLIRQIGFGHRWARTVLLILFILGMLMTPLIAPALFKTNLVLAFLFVLQTLLEISALVFLFKRSSNEWFNRFDEARQ
jgi:hypothetical protein